MSEWWAIIIPAGISIIGFVVTILITYKQFKDIKRAKNLDRQNTAYVSCFKELEKVLNTPQCIFERTYFERISSFKAEMKLIASNSTLKAYEEFITFVAKRIEEYENFESQTTPYIVETRTCDETGETYECCNVSELQMEQFEREKIEYKENSIPEHEVIKKYVVALQNAMRNDFGNESVNIGVIKIDRSI